jgi:hypothetical protein
MATWIGHLRIAEGLLVAISGLDETAFTLGNLGPDSGIPNADWSQFDPPKEVSHFIRQGTGEDKIHDLEFYRNYLLPASTDDLARYSYLLGYFFHLLADNLWSRRIWFTCKQYYAAQFAEHGGRFIWTLKKDWYDLDFKYVRDNPDCLFWSVFLPAPLPPAYLPFLPEAGIHHSLNHIRHFYSHPDPALGLDRPYPYLNEQTMARYVSDAAAAILDIHRVMETESELDGHNTALFLLSAASTSAYEPPLGDGD